VQSFIGHPDPLNGVRTYFTLGRAPRVPEFKLKDRKKSPQLPPPRSGRPFTLTPTPGWRQRCHAYQPRAPALGLSAQQPPGAL